MVVPSKFEPIRSRPSLTCPSVGELPFNSTISLTTETLPVTLSFVTQKGCVSCIIALSNNSPDAALAGPDVVPPVRCATGRGDSSPRVARAKHVLEHGWVNMKLRAREHRKNWVLKLSRLSVNASVTWISAMSRVLFQLRQGSSLFQSCGQIIGFCGHVPRTCESVGHHIYPCIVQIAYVSGVFVL